MRTPPTSHPFKEGHHCLKQTEIDSVSPDRTKARTAVGGCRVGPELSWKKRIKQAGYPTVVVMLRERTIEAGEVKLQVLEGQLHAASLSQSKLNVMIDSISAGNCHTLQPGAFRLYKQRFVKEFGHAEWKSRFQKWRRC